MHVYTTGRQNLQLVFHFVIQYADALVQLASSIKEQGIETIAISSNSIVTHPQDGPDKMAEDAKSLGTALESWHWTSKLSGLNTA